MKKRSFIAPLAVTVAALLGGMPLGAQATADPSGIDTVRSASTSPAIPQAGPFVLERATGGVQLAQDVPSHDSHSSHVSHASHDSHSSHSSGM